MVNLLLSIGCSTAIALIFKAFPKYKVTTFQAIVYNYWVCVLLGALTIGYFPLSAETLVEPWFGNALFLGTVFIGGFYLIGKTIERLGVTVTAVTQRMSLVLPVSFAFLYFSEEVNVLKILGISLALAAVYLTNKKSKSTEKVGDAEWDKIGFLLLLSVFLISGTIEIILQYTQLTYFKGKTSQMPFTICLFGIAALIGTGILLFQVLTRRTVLNFRSLLGGIIMGIPNLGSIYFLLAVLNDWEGSVVFPINNVAVIVMSGILAFFLYQERLSKINLIGVALAVFAIVLIALA